MRIERRFTVDGACPYATIEFSKTTSEIKNPDGSVVTRIEGICVPRSWSRVASDVLAQKYFVKKGVPARLVKVKEPGVPEWLWNATADTRGMANLPDKEKYGSETDARQVFDRLAGTWTYWGWKAGYFDTEADAHAFHDELRYMLAAQLAAPNSPQWFNTGLYWAYGIDRPSEGQFFVDFQSGELMESGSAYRHPQPHSCFIQGVDDDLLNSGGILDLWVREARLFKYGAGTGANFSAIRGAGEPLSRGGVSSGLMSFLNVGDHAAGSLSSGGSTRRAAKMVVVDIDHPDIEEYINWKVREEQKVAALVTGSKVLSQHLTAIMNACLNGPDKDALASVRPDPFEPGQNPTLASAIRTARQNHVSENYIWRAIQFARQGYTEISFPVYNANWDSEAYRTVSGQNSNNSIRVCDDYLNAVATGGTWDLTRRTDGQVARTVDARRLWESVCHAAWASADPGIHFHTTINDWHTCPQSGAISASNSCSEFKFLDNTASTLASVNLMKFREDDGSLDTNSFQYAARLWTIVLDISVAMAQYPSAEIARRTHDYRPVGLGYSNLGGYLMASGIAYDSDEGRARCAGITALLTGTAYATSAEMARNLTPFQEYQHNARDMLRVIRNHRRASYGGQRYEGLHTTPVALDEDRCSDKRLVSAARRSWDDALMLGRAYGFRNAQASVLAPTGTIGLVMDCDTMGIEPDFSLIKFKQLGGGGYFKIVNRVATNGLRSLGYDDSEIEEMILYAVGHGSLKQAPAINHETLKAKGFTADKIELIEAGLSGLFDIRFAFSHWALGKTFCMEKLGFTSLQLEDPDFDPLRELGFCRAEIEAANTYCCGAMTLEGAPGLKERDLPVFDCANTSGRRGKRVLTVDSHIKMLAAAQPFVSGGISKTINMPNAATVDDCHEAYLLSWRLGLKANALYRDGSKLSQPLSVGLLPEAPEQEFENSGAIPDDIVELTGRILACVADRVSAGMDKAVSEHEGYPVNLSGQQALLHSPGSNKNKDRHNTMVRAVLMPLLNDVAVAVSIGLQQGIPVDRFLELLIQPGRSNTPDGDWTFSGIGVEERCKNILERYETALENLHAEGRDAGASQALTTSASTRRRPPHSEPRGFRDRESHPARQTTGP